MILQVVEDQFFKDYSTIISSFRVRIIQAQIALLNNSVPKDALMQYIDFIAYKNFIFGKVYFGMEFDLYR